jgi:hypothetical protein
MGQILHGSATTTEAVRRAIQHSQESLRMLAERYGINQKTVAKWKKRTSVDTLLGQSFAVQALHFCSPGECWGSVIRRFPRELVRTPSDDILKHYQMVGKPELFLWLLIGTKELNLAKVGVEGSSPFARSRFFLNLHTGSNDRPPLGGLSFCGKSSGGLWPSR